MNNTEKSTAGENLPAVELTENTTPAVEYSTLFDSDAAEWEYIREAKKA